MRCLSTKSDEKIGLIKWNLVAPINYLKKPLTKKSNNDYDIRSTNINRKGGRKSKDFK